jgi:predicted acylesterase/phospholipase RssA
MRYVKGFLAGLLAVTSFHHATLWLLRLAELSPATPFSLDPFRFVGSSAVLPPLLGGLAGILVLAFGPYPTNRWRDWLALPLFYAALLTLIQAVRYAFESKISSPALPGPLLLGFVPNAAWAIGFILFVRLFDTIPAIARRVSDLVRTSWRTIADWAADFGPGIVDDFLRSYRRAFRLPWIIATLSGYIVLTSAMLQVSALEIYFLPFYVGLVPLGIAYPQIGMLSLVSWALWHLFDFAGSPRPTLDISMLGIALLISLGIILVMRTGRRDDDGHAIRRWITNAEALKLTGFFLLIGWVFLSLADAHYTAGQATGPDGRPGIVTADSRWPSVKIGLALSGGGYRAALLHAGVLSALEDFHIPVEVISSVSGASIVSGFYVRGGSPKQFVDRVVDGSFNLRREALRIDHAICLLASIHVPAGETGFRLLGFLPECTSAELQANLLRRVLLGDALHRDASVKGRPELMLGVTDLAGGRMMGLNPHGFVNLWLKPALDRLEYANSTGLGKARMNAAFFPEHLAHLPGQFRLSSLVAASGAFPGALAAVRLSAPYTVLDKPAVRFNYVLSDGGVADNSGLVLLDAAELLASEAQEVADGRWPESRQNPQSKWNISRWNIDFILASDGSALAPEESPASGLEEFVRAMDVMNITTGGTEMFAERDAKRRPHRPIILFSPRTFTIDQSDMRKGNPVVFLRSGLSVDSRLSVGLPSIGFASIEHDTFAFIICNMPVEEKAEAEKLLLELTKAGLITSDGVLHLDLGKKNGQQYQLRRLVMEELDRRLRAFVETTTLRDQIDRQTAESIYLLGRYLVWLNRRYIVCHLSQAEQSKTTHQEPDPHICETLI